MPVKFQDYYETLGVKRAATAEAIKQAFRGLARRYHPDVAKDKVAGEAKFKEINEAYEVLGDPEKRRRYDELGMDWQQEGRGPPPPPSEARGGGRARPDEPEVEFDGTGFSDFFESYFGNRTGGFGSHRGFSAGESDPEESAYRPGRDFEADLLVTLEDAHRGSRRKVTLRRPAQRGEAERSHTYNVRIPPGMREGQRIRLAGQGSAGHGTAPAGDLYLRIRFARHPDLRVQGDDLYCDLDLSPWEAILGAKANLPTLEKATTLRVPPGTVSGTQLRVRGQGLSREDGKRGDLYAEVHVQIPTTVSSEERALWEKLAAVSTFNPREIP